jgi:nucleoside 2-deoxyribosyltransferase
MQSDGYDIIIAKLTLFRGPSVDAGALVELAGFLGPGNPVFGISNSGLPFAERSRLQVETVPDPMPGLPVEGFGRPDNLMIPGRSSGAAAIPWCFRPMVGPAG